MMDTSRRISPPQHTVFSQEDRLYIFRTVSALVSVQFDALVFSLEPPSGAIPNNCSQGEKCKALLEWVESPTGPGLQAVDKYLQSVLPPDKKKLVAITIPVDINSLTYEQKIKLVESIEKITGVKVNLFEEGSIKIIASGSEEELRRLQELFTSGQLSQELDELPVQKVNLVEEDSTEARKVRLIEALKISYPSSLASFYLFFAQAIHLFRDLAEEIASTSADKLAREVSLAIDGALSSARTLSSAIDGAFSSTTDFVLSLSLSRAGNHTRELIKDLDGASEEARDLVDVLAGNLILNATSNGRLIPGDLYLASALRRYLTRARHRFLDILEIISPKPNLQGVNLSGSNLQGLFLIGADLADTILDEAFVESAIFGSNPGLSKTDKDNLQKRGAIFQDIPDSNVPIRTPSRR